MVKKLSNHTNTWMGWRAAYGGGPLMKYVKASFQKSTLGGSQRSWYGSDIGI